MKNKREQIKPPWEMEMELLSRMATMEPSSWERFMEGYGDMIYSHIVHTLRRRNFYVPQEKVDDIVQDLFLKLIADDCRRLLTYSGRKGCSLSTWLRTVARNHVLEFIRSQKTYLSISEFSPEQLHDMFKMFANTSDNPRRTVEKAEILRILDETLANLNHRERQVFQFYYRDEINGPDIARIIDTTPNNVNQMLSRIREKIKEHFSRYLTNV